MAWTSESCSSRSTGRRPRLHAGGGGPSSYPIPSLRRHAQTRRGRWGHGRAVGPRAAPPVGVRRRRRAADPSELAARAGLASSTAHRIATDLERLGMLARTASGGYVPGTTLWSLGERARRDPAARGGAAAPAAPARADRRAGPRHGPRPSGPGRGSVAVRRPRAQRGAGRREPG
ncbi:helix-turn-helix domain-containing protein [Luteimicrobium album]|uniref:helix-turn-helix domain-containing protein n=1 Tax=Luteimicrobium album TaxID=1054550 RepID=UPI003D66F859